MMDIGQMNRPTLLLIAANVVLSLVIALQLLYPAQPYRAATATPPDPATALPEFGDVTLNPPRMADLADMLGRPLFFVDRRLPEPLVETAPAAPPTPLRLKLEGVAISSGSRVAVLRNLSNNQLVQLAEGGAHDGWQLDSISSNIASFSRGEQVTELALDPGSNGRRR
jgi:hypothetical protein